MIGDDGQLIDVALRRFGNEIHAQNSLPIRREHTKEIGESHLKRSRRSDPHPLPPLSELPAGLVLRGGKPAHLPVTV
jgi:hypothetical protein